MTDQKTLAQINMFAVLGAFTHLARLDPVSRQMLEAAAPTTLRLRVLGGPKARFIFAEGCCVLTQEPGPADGAYLFSSPWRFNAMLAGERSAFSLAELSRGDFISRTLTGLTQRLAAFLLPNQAALADRDFAAISGILRFYVQAAALAEIANHDQEGRWLMAGLLPGVLSLGLRQGPEAMLIFDQGRMQARAEQAPHWDARVRLAGPAQVEPWLRGEKAAASGRPDLLHALEGLNSLARRYLWEA